MLGLGLITPIARITRAAMSEALQEDYVTFARALGLSERQVILNDAFRGSLVPIVTAIGFVISNVLAGSAIVETVFAWPGLGRYAVTAITTSDMAPVTTCVLLIAAGVAVTNLLVDLSYALHRSAHPLGIGRMTAASQAQPVASAGPRLAPKRKLRLALGPDPLTMTGAAVLALLIASGAIRLLLRDPRSDQDELGRPAGALAGALVRDRPVRPRYLVAHHHFVTHRLPCRPASE